MASPPWRWSFCTVCHCREEGKHKYGDFPSSEVSGTSVLTQQTSPAEFAAPLGKSGLMGAKMQGASTSTATRSGSGTHLHVSLQESMQICRCFMLDLSKE